MSDSFAGETGDEPLSESSGKAGKHITTDWSGLNLVDGLLYEVDCKMVYPKTSEIGMSHIPYTHREH